MKQPHYWGRQGKHALDVVAMTQVSLTPTEAKHWLTPHVHIHEHIYILHDFIFLAGWVVTSVCGLQAGIWHHQVVFMSVHISKMQCTWRVFAFDIFWGGWWLGGRSFWVPLITLILVIVTLLSHREICIITKAHRSLATSLQQWLEWFVLNSCSWPTLFAHWGIFHFVLFVLGLIRDFACDRAGHVEFIDIQGGLAEWGHRWVHACIAIWGTAEGSQVKSFAPSDDGDVEGELAPTVRGWILGDSERRRGGELSAGPGGAGRLSIQEFTVLTAGKE